MSDLMEDRDYPAWVSIEPSQLSGRVVSFPKREDIDLSIDENLIVEYYSR